MDIRYLREVANEKRDFRPVSQPGIPGGTRTPSMCAPARIRTRRGHDHDRDIADPALYRRA